MYINSFDSSVITIQIDDLESENNDIIRRSIDEWVADYGFGLGEICILQDEHNGKPISYPKPERSADSKESFSDFYSFERHKYVRFNLVFPKDTNIQTAASDLGNHLSTDFPEINNNNISIIYSHTYIYTANISNKQGGKVVCQEYTMGYGETDNQRT